jgi:hypothetical protein
MKKTSTLAPLLIGSLVAMLQFTSAPEARAFGGSPGGPFSNGSYFPNDGTFSAVVRGENLSGTVQFSTTAGAGASGSVSQSSSTTSLGSLSVSNTTSTSSTGGVGSTGVATIYYDGDTYFGNSQGSYNPQASTMAVTFQADAQGQGEQEFEVSTIVDLGDLITTTTIVNPDGTVVTTDTVTPQREITPQTSIIYFDSFYLNGFANCKTSNAFPNQIFSGKGEARLQYLIQSLGLAPIPEAVTLPLSVSGVRLSNSASTFNTSEVRPPSVNEVTILN